MVRRGLSLVSAPLFGLALASGVPAVLSAGPTGGGQPGASGGRLPPAAVEELATPRRPEELKLKPLQFNPAAAERVTLPCGIPVILVQDRDFPVCDLTIQFRMGARYLPAEMHPASQIMSASWRSGGTEALPPDSLDAVLAALDAGINSFVGLRNGEVAVSLAAQDLDQVLPLWRDLVLHPRFDPERVGKAREDVVKDLQSINNNPEAIAAERIHRLVQGRDYPTSHYATKAECEAVTPADLLALHRRFVVPRNALIGVSGDFDRNAILTRLERLFGDWPNADGAPPVEPVWTPCTDPGVYLLPGEYEQSQVRIGRIIPGLTRKSPEYAAAVILSFAFGYGRVFYAARAAGLSYGATVMLNSGEEFTTVNGFGSCRTQVTTGLLRTMLSEMERLQTTPLTADEMETARTFQIGATVREFETPAQLVSAKVTRMVLDEPDAAQDLQGLEQATLAEVNQLSRTCAAVKDSLVVLVLGNPKEFDAPLDSLGLGPVRVLESVEFGK